jgi:hypothetical protein
MTRFLRLSSTASLLALGALTAGLAPHVLRAEAFCNNATMKGTYIASGTGMVGTGATFSPMAIVGLLIYNGDGTGASLYGTTTVAGNTTTASNVPATFTVNPDCTGSKTIGTTNFNFVITPDGSTITWIVTNAGVTLMGTGVRSSTLTTRGF